ncbi:hypothetical protein F5876DRAFT_70743 [Lentinula aff. lateritia]|uniref:Uncharacterized protein n=1 Tax=Lentinula aff. lateritia TaxID=2804960 RepID=A0ACC1THY2_9AGAR|nr:hypothetical protein F5876DRAFT_70743 [Lentinula aff. lateritia]
MSSELASSTATYSSSQMGVSTQASLMDKFLSFVLRLLPDPGHPYDGPASRLFSVFADKTREEAFIELSIILGFTILVSCTYKVREKAVVQKEVMIVQQTRTLQLDVEIELYKRLAGVLERSAATARDRASDFEMEKELFLEELVRDHIPTARIIEHNSPKVSSNSVTFVKKGDDVVAGITGDGEVDGAAGEDDLEKYPDNCFDVASVHKGNDHSDKAKITPITLRHDIPELGEFEREVLLILAPQYDPCALFAIPVTGGYHSTAAI